MLSLGYDSVDVDPGFLKSIRNPNALEKPVVACVAAGHLLPNGSSLEAIDEAAREVACAHVLASFNEALNLGAQVVYVAAPALGPGNRKRYGQSMIILADRAKAVGLQLCMEPSPHSELPSIASMVDFIEEIGHDNLYVLLDVGHCLIANEDPPSAVTRCGSSLGYVHFDDNDGNSDLHLALTDGILTHKIICETLSAIHESPYRGPIAVEGKLTLLDPTTAMAKSLHILRECIDS
jgi:sugar phosphate isomerase/epimerase